MKQLLATLLIVIPMFLGMDSVYAGNLSLIEKRLLELDRLNKDVVEKTGPIPENGSVSLEAKIGPGAADTKGGINGRKIEFSKNSVVSIDQKTPFTVQISASRSQQQCFRVAAMLRRAGYPAFTGAIIIKDQGLWHRIFVGSFLSSEEAEKVRDSLQKDEIDDTLVRKMPYAIQVGQEGNLDSHKSLREKLLALQYMPYTSYVRDTANNAAKVRLLLGAFESKEECSTLLNTLRGKGIEARAVLR